MKGDFYVKESNDGICQCRPGKYSLNAAQQKNNQKFFWNIPNKTCATEWNFCRLQIYKKLFSWQCSEGFLMMAASKRSILKLLDLLEQIFQSKCNILKQSLLFKSFKF